MLLKTFVRNEELNVEGHSYTVDYFAGTTPRGTQRYSAELLLGPDDRIILDAGTLSDLELRVARLMPATLQSRILAAKAPAA
jgi:hypothetical protein